MTHPQSTFLQAPALALALAFFAAHPCAANGLNGLRENMVKEFDGKFVGYAFAIAQDGRIRRAGAGGKARISGDGNMKMTTRVRQNVASVSKTITAIAVLQLLEKNNLNIESRVAPHLPKNWRRGPNFSPSQLLPHLSFSVSERLLKR